MHEQSLFGSIGAVLSQHRSGILTRMIEMREPELMPIVLPMPSVEQPTKQDTFEEPAVPDKKHVKFVDSVDQFAGEELELYGPYAANDEAELPHELAEVLISQGKAVEL